MDGVRRFYLTVDDGLPRQKQNVSFVSTQNEPKLFAFNVVACQKRLNSASTPQRPTRALHEFMTPIYQYLNFKLNAYNLYECNPPIGNLK
jgi:hypothetical protein